MVDSSTQSAYDVMLDLLRRYSLDSLAPAVLGFLQDGFTQEQVSFMIQDTPEYKARFAGNEKRRAAGIPALDPRDYLSVESAYRQILSSNGMPVGFYDQPSDFADWIGKDVSPQEILSRVNLATDAANRLDSDTLSAFSQWYGVGPNDLAAFFLDQDRALPQIQKIAKAVNIGADAKRDQLAMDQTHAEDLAGFAGDRNVDNLMGQVAELSKRGTDLASIHNLNYGQTDAESEVFKMDEKARKRRTDLAAMEDAEFRGSSGVGKSTFGKPKSY